MFVINPFGFHSSFEFRHSDFPASRGHPGSIPGGNPIAPAAFWTSSCII
jgi:hypothetical protein